MIKQRKIIKVKNNKRFQKTPKYISLYSNTVIEGFNFKKKKIKAERYKKHIAKKNYWKNKITDLKRKKKN